MNPLASCNLKFYFFGFAAVCLLVIVNERRIRKLEDKGQYLRFRIHLLTVIELNIAVGFLLALNMMSVHYPSSLGNIETWTYGFPLKCYTQMEDCQFTLFSNPFGAWNYENLVFDALCAMLFSVGLYNVSEFFIRRTAA